MVEITKKYKIGTRRFGLINWVGAWTLYQKEDIKIFKCLGTNAFFSANLLIAIFVSFIFSYRN